MDRVRDEVTIHENIYNGVGAVYKLCRRSVQTFVYSKWLSDSQERNTEFFASLPQVIVFCSKGHPELHSKFKISGGIGGKMFHSCQVQDCSESPKRSPLIDVDRQRIKESDEFRNASRRNTPFRSLSVRTLASSKCQRDGTTAVSSASRSSKTSVAVVASSLKHHPTATEQSRMKALVVALP